MLPILRWDLQELWAGACLIVGTSLLRQLRKIWVCVEVRAGLDEKLLPVSKGASRAVGWDDLSS